MATITPQTGTGNALTYAAASGGGDTVAFGSATSRPLILVRNAGGSACPGRPAARTVHGGLRKPPGPARTSPTGSWGPISCSPSPATLAGGDVAGQWTSSLAAGQGILTRRASGVAQRFTPGARNI